MKTSSLSQLWLSEKWGEDVGDHLCGPLAFFELLKRLSSTRKVTRAAEFKAYQSFLGTHFDGIGQAVDLEDAIERLRPDFARQLKSYRIRNLHRKSGQQKFTAAVHLELRNALVAKRPVILQLGAYHAEVARGRNTWKRGLGHFVVGLGVEAVAGPQDPFFTIRYWDPWDGLEHRAVLHEELYRDFTAVDFRAPVATRPINFRGPLRRSPSGHDVLSPYLCLLAPHMDLYDPKIYFGQRSLLALERALL